jgi:seryl-tRNA synthetase
MAASTSSSSTTSTDDSATTNSEITVHGRLSRQDLSLDIRTITQHNNVVLSHLQARRANAETLENAKSMINLMNQRVALIHERDAALQQRNQASALIGRLMAQKSKRELSELEQAELEAAKETSVQAGKSAEIVEAKLETIQTSMDELLAGIPNLLDDRVPDGEDERDNEIVSEWGDPQRLPQILGWNDFTPLWHDDIARRLGGYADEAAVAMSGSRFVALKHDVARLERAIASFFVDMHVQNGYTEVSVPLVVSRSALEGTSQLPKFEEDLFRITNESHTCNGQDAFLIPTAEVPVTNLHRDSILEESDLPLSYVSWTPCFRAEAGSYGRDTKGLIRTHQFQKVELVKITTPETSDEQHELLTGHAEECLRSLELPYRKVRLCSGDLGFAARHCYDLEVWLPGAGEYREISSCSNTGDFQARRMALRYRPDVKKTDSSSTKKKVKPQFCHTINGSGLAVGRTLVAILENYQKPDGSVMVPKVLQPYMGGKECLFPPAAKS